jgi:hypothetical protein
MRSMYIGGRPTLPLLRERGSEERQIDLPGPFQERVTTRHYAPATDENATRARPAREYGPREVIRTISCAAGEGRVRASDHQRSDAPASHTPHRKRRSTA